MAGDGMEENGMPGRKDKRDEVSKLLFLYFIAVDGGAVIVSGGKVGVIGLDLDEHEKQCMDG
jgi:hypothetical protein